MSATATPRRRLVDGTTLAHARVDLRVPLDLHHRLAAVAVKNDRSTAAEARIAFARHVDRELGGAER